MTNRRSGAAEISTPRLFLPICQWFAMQTSFPSSLRTLLRLRSRFSAGNWRGFAPKTSTSTTDFNRSFSIAPLLFRCALPKAPARRHVAQRARHTSLAPRLHVCVSPLRPRSASFASQTATATTFRSPASSTRNLAVGVLDLPRSFLAARRLDQDDVDARGAS